MNRKTNELWAILVNFDLHICVAWTKECVMPSLHSYRCAGLHMD